MGNKDMTKVHEMVDDLIARVDLAHPSKVEPLLDKLDAYQHSIRSARNDNRITGEEFRSLMVKLGPAKARAERKK